MLNALGLNAQVDSVGVELDCTGDQLGGLVAPRADNCELVTSFLVDERDPFCGDGIKRVYDLTWFRRYKTRGRINNVDAIVLDGNVIGL